MTLLLFYLLLAIGVSFICSIAEAVLLSIRPSYIASLDRQSRTAVILNRLRANLDRPLAAILTANTIAHTVGAAGVGAQAAFVFGSEYLGVISAVLTFLILVFSEIIPKTIGAVYWQGLAPFMGRVIHWMTILLYPFVWCSQRLTKFISKSDKPTFTYSRDEVEAMIDIGKEEGVIASSEHTIVSNLMKLDELSVRDIMTPRPVILSASQDMSVAEFFDQYAQTSFSRIPIYDKNSDDITGYILKTELLIAQAKDEFQRTLKEFVREFPFLPETINAYQIYDELVHKKVHMALIIDEFGAVQGLVTLEDVIETLIGLEITDELDKVEDMQSLARTRWKARMEGMGIDPEDILKARQE